MGNVVRAARTVSFAVIAAALLATVSVARLSSGLQAPDEQARATLYPNPVGSMEFLWELSTLATGDFDHDGHADAAVSDGCCGVDVLLGAGNGAFAPAAHYESSGSMHGPSQVLSADFDGDGNLDLAVSDYRSFDDVHVFPGNGDGTFGTAIPYGSAGGAYSVAAGDLDGDGRADLATTSIYTNDVGIFLGRGDGTFETAGRFPAGGMPWWVVMADLDADNRLDLVAANGDSIGVLRGRGDGTFDAAAAFAPGFFCYDLAVADVDEDGRADIVARVSPETAPTGPGFGVFRGNGDGTFGPATLSGWQTKHDYGGAVAVHDVDGDGHLDVVLPAYFDSSYSSVAIAFGFGNGAFGPQEIHGGPGRAVAVGFADFDGDAKTDIAAVDLMAEGATVLFNHGGRVIGDRPPAYTAGLSPISARIADFDADGRPDVAVLDRVSDKVSILMGSGDGVLLPESRFSTGGLPGLGAIAADDFDGDGRIDLAVGLRASGNVSILRGAGDGTFQPPLSFPFGVGTFYLISADLNHDGDPDLVTSNSTAGTVSILIGAPGAAFGPPTPYAVPSAGALAAADFDADGHVDLAVAGQTSQSSAIWLLRGAGNGTFSATVAGTFAGAVSGLAAGDLDGDDRSDLALVEGTTAEWLRGRGDGTFEGAVVVAARSAGPVHVADADADGFPDIVTVGSWITIVPGNGDGTFADPDLFLGARGFSPGLGDLDLDGGLDLVLPTQSDVMVLLNRHPPDADHDGVPDRHDNCPTIANPDQDPEACRQSVEGVTVSVGVPLARGAWIISWDTTHEVTLLGFNLVSFDAQGRRVQLNDALIACEACVTGLGRSYNVLLSKHRGGQNVFVETVCTTGCGGPWGPAVRE